MRQIIEIIPTWVPRTSAAHLMAGRRNYKFSVTAVWSTVPVACTDWLLGDETSQCPVHYAADRVPAVKNIGEDLLPSWHVFTKVRCGVCGQMIGPPAEVHRGHLVGNGLASVAREVAKLADEKREYQRSKLIAHLTDDAERLAHSMADYILATRYPIAS